MIPAAGMPGTGGTTLQTDTAVGGPEPSPGPGEDRLSDRGRLRKAPTAFRTISEVADELHVPQHVLRFWETRFGQVSPLKRGGGRRYYRPDDVTLLRRIADLLYVQGYTIKGVQRLLAEGGSLEGDLPPPELVDADLSHPASGGDADAPQSGLAAMVAGADPGDTTEPVASSDGTDRLAAEGTLRRTLAETLAALEDIRRTLAV